MLKLKLLQPVSLFRSLKSGSIGLLSASDGLARAPFRQSEPPSLYFAAAGAAAVAEARSSCS